ncbi:MAG: hypothetical protein PW788_14500 [Micavibrio sp.]|nr:hypothetical protein [Micavibrio sp.]
MKRNLKKDWDKLAKSQQPYSLAVIWGKALPVWDKILAEFLPEEIKDAYIIDLGEQAKKFVVESYNRDGIDETYAMKKSMQIVEDGTKFGIIELNISPEEMAQRKKNIREKYKDKVKDYFFESIIHVLEDRKTTSYIKKFLDQRRVDGQQTLKKTKFIQPPD